MSRALIILIALAVLAGIATGAYIIATHTLHAQQAPQAGTYQHRYGHGATPHGAAAGAYCRGRKVIIVLLPGFRWREFHVTYNMLKNKGAETIIACPEPYVYGVREGYSAPIPVHCNITLSPSLDGDALIIIGGPGEYCALLYYLYRNSEIANTSNIVKLIHECSVFLKALHSDISKSISYVNAVVDLVRKFYTNNRIIGAICVAPTFLAIAGILHETKITMYNAPILVKYVSEHGGIVELSKSVVISGNIVTANGPEASQYFAKALVEKICR